MAIFGNLRDQVLDHILSIQQPSGNGKEGETREAGRPLLAKIKTLPTRRYPYRSPLQIR